MIKSLGRLYGLGVGPGDPELITVKALRLLQSVSVVAYPIGDRHQLGLARSIVAEYIQPTQIEIPLYFPFKSKVPARSYYDLAAKTLAEYLQTGQDVVFLCEGDPFFYGTFMYLYNRLAERFPTEVIPGVSSVIAAASALKVPLTYRNDVYLVIPAILPAEILQAKLAIADAAVIIKLGKHFNKVRNVLRKLELDKRAKYIANATMKEQQIQSIDLINSDDVPYFSAILIPSQSKEIV